MREVEAKDTVTEERPHDIQAATVGLGGQTVMIIRHNCDSLPVLLLQDAEA